jgi:ATPase involved in DNA repair/ATPase family associated with various cellular activities (AAA)
MVQQDQSADIVDSAVAEGGAYEIIRKRLVEQGQQLDQKTRELNDSRLGEFGSSDMSVAARVRVRTENNCIARDIVQVGEHLLFGYNVFIGLKKETKIEDVFALFDVREKEGNFEMEPVAFTGTFLAESSFVNDFEELYRYYKHTKLVELTIKDGKLLAGFQIGERLEDIRVFRWSVSADGKSIKYIDNRGERDIQLPPAYDFEWVETAREDVIHGRHPHVNILDKVFVETINGDLTVKIEDNTEDGLGVFREPVEDKTQSLDDAEIHYASVGSLILLKIRPYREEQWRYLIFNTLTQEVIRVDAIGESCVQLPEDHGIIFPGGYYLQTGEYKTFDDEAGGLKFKRSIRSPNGEDVLFVFYEPGDGIVGLLAYNMIEKQLQNPIYGHGYALAENGQLVIFSAETEPTRVHPMQIWHTPYVSAEFASKSPTSQTFLGRIGNAELVRGVSDLYSISRIISNQSVSSRLYEELSKSAKKIFDDHYWIEETETQSIAAVLKEISATAELVIDEFEKVESIRQQSTKTMLEAERSQDDLVQSIRPENWQIAEEYVDALGKLRHQRGHLVTIKDYRYIDTDRVEQLDQQLREVEESLSEKTVAFLSDEKSFEPYLQKVEELNKEVEAATTKAVLQPLIQTIEDTASGLDLLSELMGTLKVQDATVTTRIIDAISQVYSKLNQCKAGAKHKQKNLGSAEAVAQFGAQFKLFSQSITNALGLAATPEKCDEQLSRLLVQLEELESQFSDFDQFLTDIMDKREEVYESFENHKQQLLDERQRKAQSITDASDRILSSIEKRSLKFADADDLNTYFAADALVMKIREQVERLRKLDSAVKADDIESRFKSIKEQALRSLRDKTDIFEDGGNIIKLGPRHKFSVNTQELDLTIIPRSGELNIHLTGTDYYEPIIDADLLALKDYWEMSLESETPDVYRGEYLAALIIEAARTHQHGLDHDALHHALLDEQQLNQLVREFAAPRYKEGYEKGIHDHDAALILKTLIPAIERADLLTFDPLSRGLAQVFWANLKSGAKERAKDTDVIPFATWPERARSAYQMQSIFASTKAVELLVQEIRAVLTQFLSKHPISVSELDVLRASRYLVAELGRERVEFIGSKYAQQLVDELKRSLDDNTWRRYQAALNKMLGWPAERWNLSTAWLQALVDEKKLTQLAGYIPEAVALINADERLDRRSTEVDLELSVEGLLGDHANIEKRILSFALDVYLQRMERHRVQVVPAYHRYLQVRQDVITREREQLRLEEFKARPLSSFVRNRLINESYLPLIGDNLAKQMGTVGEDKRTDLMGLLMMISPPGYGKTTLMEYVANRLGLIFMKINCPSLGHDVLSLDPEQAPNATARQELEKLNLGLEMGNNVMLYLDDIQHTHPEFLQKFISLCDGTRRIEGIWKGKTKTYDMRGRKFCVVMAGNPYTESGEAFKIPDMLANRADIYNLGDILGGMDEQFALSYIENALTSNQVLAPLAVREMDDVYKLINMAKGANVAATDLNHQYSGAEVNEITEIFKKMMVIQDVVLKINMQYIASAAQDDKYRTEPSFKLQGSYRNMNKMTEKVSAVMNEAELMQMIADHYLGEAQLLTTGAEGNLLKLAELRGNMTAEQDQRWTQIQKDFLRNKAMGGDESDVGGKVVAQLVDLVNGVQDLNEVAFKATQPKPVEASPPEDNLTEILGKLTAAVKSNKPNVEVVNQPVPGMDKILTVLADTIEHSIFPLVRSMDKKLDIDLRTHEKMKDISEQLRSLENTTKAGPASE